jgi:selenocysteine-specific elongation factor
MENLVIGTAGHVDHGKTSLIKALTGINTDTLKEEKQRGITVNLGFTYLNLDQEHTVGIVDVPGHEGLIKNMLAGVCGINLILLTVAADDGVMPQTREHMEIIKFLHVKNVIVVITKTDLVTKERVAEVKKQVENVLKLNHFVEFSIYQPETVNNVIQMIKANLIEEENANKEIFRMSIDRVFNVKGQGVVITGSSLSGTVRIGDELEILPTKQKVKVRGIQSFNKPQQIAYKHMRVALNLGGVKKEAIKRGKILSTINVFSTPSKIIDVKIVASKYLTKPIKNLEKVKFYYLASEVKCRIKLINCKQVNALDVVYGQLLLDEGIYANNQDLGVLRRVNPIETIAGIEIINIFGEHVSRKDDSYLKILKLYEKQDVGALINYYLHKHNFIKLNDLKQKLNLLNHTDESLIGIIKNSGMIFADNTCLSFEGFKTIKERFITLLTKYHQDNPYDIGMNKQICQQELGLKLLNNKTFTELIAFFSEIELKNDKVKLTSFSINYSQEEQKIVTELQKYIDSFNFKPPKLVDILLNIKAKNVKRLYYSLISEKELILFDKDIVLTKSKYAEMIKLMDQFFSKNKVLKINDAKEILDTSRKYLVAFLEYLDKVGYTRRVEEGRIKRI